MPVTEQATRHPGITKRGDRYAVRYRAGGVRHRVSVRTLSEALEIKRTRETARDRGEHDLITEGKMPFREFASDWVERYQGNGKRGFSDDTRDDYRRDLGRFAYPFLGNKKLSSIGPRDISNWIAWLTDEDAQGKRLADGTIRRILSPVRACLATARREGVVRSNAADAAVLPKRPSIDDGEKVKALTREELKVFFAYVPKEWRLFFRVLVATGLRWGEIVALRWKDLDLDGSDPSLTVRQNYVRGRFTVPKSGKPRTIPLDWTLAQELRASARGGELVFPNANGKPLDHTNTLRRVLRPAAVEAGVEWAGFHTFRHTCASLLFSSGRNAKQVQKILGHSTPAFTLSVYIHLMDDGVGGPLELDNHLRGGSSVGPDPQAIEGTTPEAVLAEAA